MSENDPIVFVVDDDEDIRTSLSRALSKRGFTVESYASALDFLEEFEPERTGCLILDYGLPQMSGLELQRRLHELGHALPIIFITGHGGVPESVEAMKWGAIDFLEKPFRQDLLVEHIKTALEKDASRRDSEQEVASARERFDVLTPREREIVEFILANPATTSSKEVARALDVSPRTIDHHRARILDKMGVKSVVELVDLSSVAKLNRI